MKSSPYQIHISESSEDDEWDDFVEFEAGGHFEQTSRWGQVKEEAGWQCLRMVAYSESKVMGGAQVLLHDLPLVGRAGYIPRGPIICPDCYELLPLIVQKVKDSTKKKGVRFLIAQAPQGQGGVDEALSKEGFIPDNSLGIITATTCIDLSQSYETILSRMNRNSRRNIKYAEQNGVTVLEGSETDIPLFFQMMVETCKRQGVDPNPPAESHVRKLWDSFTQHGRVRLSFALWQGEVVSGLIGIPFGQAFYAWKIGWTGRFERSGANHLLHWDAIKWAKANGYGIYDFMALDRHVAEAALEGNHLHSAAKGSALFKLSFGGDVILLPVARTYIDNQILSFFYRKIYPPLRSLRNRIRSYRLHLRSGVPGTKGAVQ